MKKTLFILFGIGIIVILILLGSRFPVKNISTITVNTDQTEALKTDIPISVSDNGTLKLSSTPEGLYVPNTMRVKLGTNVRIEADAKTLTGGMDTIIIDAYGIRKVISPQDNVVEFIADKAGNFRVYCANGMGNGTLEVI